MSWRAITVDTTLAEGLERDLLAVASDRATWTLPNFGSMIMRVSAESSVRFYFSPRAAELFAVIIAQHAGAPCDPPLGKQLVPSRTARLLLGFKAGWEPLQPVRLAPKRISVQPPQPPQGGNT